MNNKRLVPTAVILIVLFTLNSSAQENDKLGTEVVNIVKPYSPTISDAFKVKESPVLNDSVATQKKEVHYSIFSVPVASTFTPAKGTATAVEKSKPLKLYDNYATLGFGNYTSILGEFFSNFQLSRTDNAGLFFRHNSSQGEIDGVLLDNKYYDTSLEANYSSMQKDLSYKAEIGLEHQVFNWYGLSEAYNALIIDDNNFIDPQQNYYSVFAGGHISVADSFFDRAALKIRYLGDTFSSSEINLVANPEFSFPLTELTLKIDGDLNYLNGSFDKKLFGGMGHNYSYFNAGIIPSLVYVNEDLTFSLGVAGYFGSDLENSTSELSIYPRINVSYRLVDEIIIVYGGADGGLVQNTYYDFKNLNPFVSPTLIITPTNQLYEGFAGLKGKLSNSVGYNIRGSYGKEEHKPLLLINSAQLALTPSEGYEYGNSFQVIYDDIITLSFYGELKVEVSEKLSLGLTGEYFSYETTNEMEAWNLPEIKASIFSNFNISEKVYGGASLFFVGERKARPLVFGPGLFPDVSGISLESYVDLNAQFGYRFNEQLSIFASGSNLLGDNYLKWANYPVQGIQGLLGATYKFDW